jgi:predicted extracellular nuclease
MKLADILARATAAALSLSLATAQTIGQINGNRFISPYRNQNVYNVTGLVTATGPNGLWIRSTTPDSDTRTSESIYVFGKISSTSNLTVAAGDVIVVDGLVSEYRSNPAYLYLTEISRPTNVKVISRGNPVGAVVLGRQDTSPPTEQYTSLDDGNVFTVPNNASQISTANPVLQPWAYGLDFWESLSGELVTVRGASAVAKPNSYNETWVSGNWRKTGKNSRGGLTLTPGDANPEAIIIGAPLDGTVNPSDIKLGDQLEDITGVVSQQFGYYYILPLTALSVTDSMWPALPSPVSWTSTGSCSTITVGQYNVENLAANSSTLPSIADHIASYLNSPDLVFLQEIQDNSGPRDDGIVSANATLETLVAAIEAAGGVSYAYIDIDPENDQDGGQPGGNIRPAYLYNPEVLSLKDTGNHPAGSALDANAVLPGPALKYNPGLIDPENPAWEDSRKPIAAQWETVRDKSILFTVNVHFTSKGGSSTIQGDPRAPVNGGVDQRIAQATVAGEFVARILAEDPTAAVIAAGDFNEFAFVAPLETFVTLSGLVNLDDAAGITPTERYTYLFEMNSQELDHMFVSPKIAAGSSGGVVRPELKHVHVNTWVSYAEQISDHDPSVARFNIC